MVKGESQPPNMAMDITMGFHSGSVVESTHSVMSTRIGFGC